MMAGTQSEARFRVLLKMQKMRYPVEKITSFTINHLKLLPGVYVSRKDRVGSETVTTFDLRMTQPNAEPVMNTADQVLYFGPMGCRTGFYLLLAGDHDSEEIVPLVRGMYEFIRDYEGEIPGASPRDCGNYLDMNLSTAKWYARRYLKDVLEHPAPERLIYPD